MNGQARERGHCPTHSVKRAQAVCSNHHPAGSVIDHHNLALKCCHMYSAARMAYLLIIKQSQTPKTAGIQLLLLPPAWRRRRHT
jgi:hypothetical protein